MEGLVGDQLRRGKTGTPSYGQLPPAARKQKKQLLDLPIRQLALRPQMSVADLVEAMAGMSIQARNVGLCAQVLTAMYEDPDRPTIFLGLAGPLIAAGLRKVIRDLIESGAVDVVVSTGAILYQDIYQARGYQHYAGTPDADDAALRELHIDRIYDTYVDEDKFWSTDGWIGRQADDLPPGTYSSRQFLEHIADRLTDPESIVVTCRRHGVPVYSPAINDSSIGIGLTNHRVRATRTGRPYVAIDSIQDNHEIVQVVVQSKKTAAIYVAGGVPKNYINDSIVMAYIYGLERGHDYAIQLTTAVTADGGLSGSTLSEARSWGKIKSKARYAMAWVEPSVSLPLVAGYVFGRDLVANRRRLRFDWDGYWLRSLKPATSAKVGEGESHVAKTRRRASSATRRSRGKR